MNRQPTTLSEDIKQLNRSAHKVPARRAARRQVRQVLRQAIPAARRRNPHADVDLMLRHIYGGAELVYGPPEPAF